MVGRGWSEKYCNRSVSYLPNKRTNSRRPVRMGYFALQFQAPIKSASLSTTWTYQTTRASARVPKAGDFRGLVYNIQ